MDKKILITAGSAVASGLVAKGAIGMLDLSRNTKIGLSILGVAAGIYGLHTVKSGQNALQGAYMGVVFVEAMEGIKAIADTDKVRSKIDTTTKIGQFGSKMLGLSAGLEYDDQGNYLPSGMNGYQELEGLGYATVEDFRDVSNFRDESLGYLEEDGDGLGYLEEDGDGLGYLEEDGDGLGYPEEENFFEN